MYPYKAKKKQSKELHTAVCIIERHSESGKEYLLFQRPKEGRIWIWIWMWFFSFSFFLFPTPVFDVVLFLRSYRFLLGISVC
jgi:hypothetical protein